MNAHGKPLPAGERGRKQLKKRHLEAPPDSRRNAVSPLSESSSIFLQGLSDTPRSRVAQNRRYFSRNRLTRRSTAAYIAGVTRPVCVFCWLG
jgi:hypothetical protein